MNLIVRQKGDPRFAEILNNIKIGTLSEADKQDLYALHTDTTAFSRDSVHLLRTNILAGNYDHEQLQNLPGSQFTIKCQDTKKDLHTTSPVTVTTNNIYETGGLPSEIEIAVWAPYMLTKNLDTADHSGNGVIGTIHHIDI